jgi:hypothetical protein
MPSGATMAKLCSLPLMESASATSKQLFMLITA